MDSLVGKTIDNYHILEIIGRGGMGVVFKALDNNLEKVVALKMIDPFLGRDEGFVRRFKTEAKALAKLENSNIVGVHALRETESGFFMVMEYVESKPLSQSLREKGAFSIQETMSILKQLLSAIGHAHQAGVIHRDIKPSNILLCENGRIKVTDFGLAKVVEQKGPSSTVTQARAGTLHYMSPEQVKGLKNVDKRSDLYSLGMTVYEMITGRVPFDKEDSDYTIQKKIVDGDIPSPVKFNSGIPKQLIKIIAKSIHKDPDKRYQSAEAMLEDVCRYENVIPDVNDKTILQLQPETGSKFKIKLKKNALFIISFGVLIALTLLFIIFSSGKEKNIDSYISIETIPDGAEVFIDKDFGGKSPVSAYELKTEGNTLVSVRKQGYVPIDTIIGIQSGKINKIKINLIAINSEKNIPRTNLDGVAEIKYGKLKVISQPAGASIFLNDEFVGSTTYENKYLETGTYKLSIRKKGHAEVTEQIKIAEDMLTEVTKELAVSGKLSVYSEPGEASVSINKKLVGKTPYLNDDIMPGLYTVSITKTGFKTYSEKIKIESNNQPLVINQKLESLMCRIEILVRPFGSIYIDDQLKAQDINSPFITDLQVGRHQLRLVHPKYGNIPIEINITDTKSKKYNFDLSRALKLTVVSNLPNCEVFINGVSTEKYTPTQITLKTGSHRVQVKKEGYSSIPVEKMYSIGYEIYEELKDREERIEFNLEKIN